MKKPYSACGWIISFLWLCGCAQHAKIDAFTEPKVQHQSWQGQCFAVELLYAQPKPGVLSDGQAQPLKPFNEAEKSSGAVEVLKALPDIIKQQLPAGVEWGTKNHCAYQLQVAVEAFDKRGPAYPVYPGKNFAKSLMTLGLDMDSDYDITANFIASYQLQKQNDGVPIFSQRIKVDRKVPHEHGAFDFSDNPWDYARQLFRQQLARTLNDFFRQAAQKDNP